MKIKILNSGLRTFKTLALTLGLIMCFVVITTVLAATSGPRNGGTFADDGSIGTKTWASTGNAITSNNSYATVALNDFEISHYLKATNFGFSIPAGSTINGITVEVEKKAANPNRVKDYQVRIVKGGTIGPTDRADGSFWGNSDSYTTYGGASDLWGETWTANDINNNGFGLAFSAQKTVTNGGNVTTSIDHIRITVTYTAAVAPTVISISSTSPNGSYSSGIIPVTVTFDQSVTVTGTPTLTLETGATDAVVNYAGGSPGSTLTFNYTIAAGHTSSDLDYTGTGALALNGGTIKDTASGLLNATLTLPTPGAAGSLGANKDIVIDTTAPLLSQVSISSNNADNTKAKVGDIVTLNITSNEDIQTPTVSIGGSPAAIAGGSLVWTASRSMVIGDSEGVIPFTVNFTDLAGNSGTQVTSTTDASSVTFDKTAPSLSEFTAVTTPTNNSTPSYTFDSDEAGTISYGGGCTSASGAAVAQPAHNTITFNALADGTYNCIIAVTDSTGNTSTDLNVSTFVIDTADPTIVITSTASDPTNVSPIPFVATFNEAVSGFDISDIAVGNGSVTNFTPDLVTAPIGSVYNFEVTPSGQGLVTVDIAGSVCTDLAGNNNSAALQVSRTFDSVNPTLTLTTTAPDPTNTSPIPVTATFSENVTGFDLGDISVVNGAAGNLLGGPSIYTFDVTPSVPGPITVTIDVGAAGAQDSAGNGNDAAISTINIEYDSVKPTVILASTSGDPTNVSPIPMTATFSQDVTGFDVTDIVVGNGNAGNFAGGPSVYSFDVTPSGQGLVTIDVPANIAQDAATNTNFAAVQYSLTYDTVAPLITTAVALDTNGDGIMDRLSLTFDEALQDKAAGSNGFDVTSASDHGLCNSESADPDGTAIILIDFVCTNVNSAVDDLTLNLTSNSEILDAANNQVASVAIDSSSIPPITDGAKPVVANSVPSDGAVGVIFNGNLIINFSEEMIPGTFIISDDDSNNYTSTVWSNSNKTVTLTHDNWTLNNLVNVTVDASDLGALSLNGLGNYNFSFTTGLDQYLGRITVPSALVVTDAGTDLSNGVSTEAGGNVFINAVSQILSAITDGDLIGTDLTLMQIFGDQAMIPLKDVMMNSTGVINLTNSGIPNVSISIPNHTTVYGCLAWDGKLTLKAGDNTGTAPTGFQMGSSVYEIGSSICPLLLSQPVTVTITGLTGDMAFKPSGSTNWYAMNVCGGTYAAPTPPTAPTPFSECYISDGVDTKIVTYHFTTFGNMTPVVIPPVTPSGSAGGGGSYIYKNINKLIEAETVSETTLHGAAVRESDQCNRIRWELPYYEDLRDQRDRFYVKALYTRCAIDGISKNFFGTDDPITKADLSKAVVTIFKLDKSPYYKLFADVSEDDPNMPYLLGAAKLGLINGRSVTSQRSMFLDPATGLSRAEVLFMALKGRGVDLDNYTKEADFVDVSKNDWFYTVVALAKNENLIDYSETKFMKEGQVSSLYKFSRLLGIGSSGRDVQNLKTVMKQLDYYSGEIDTIYDQELSDAIKVYQKANGIMQTGFMGILTRASLLKEYLHPKTISYFKPYDLISRKDTAKVVYLVDHLYGPGVEDVLGVYYSRTNFILDLITEFVLGIFRPLM